MPSQAAPRKWYVLGVLFCAAVLSYTDRLILNALAEPLRLDLQLTDTQVSLLQGAAFAVIYSLAALPLGRLADFAHRRNLLLAGVALWSAGTVLCGLARDFQQLFAARLLVGLGEAGLFPAGMSLLLAYFPARQRATVIGIFFTGAALGGGAAVLVDGFLLHIFTTSHLPDWLGLLTPWRCVLLALAIPGLILCALLVTVAEPLRDHSGTSSGPRNPGGLTALWQSGPVVGFLLLALLFQAVADYGSGAWLPSLLVRHFGLSPEQAAIELGRVVLVGAVLGPILGGLLADFLHAHHRARHKPLMTSVMLLAGVPLSYLCFAPRPLQTIWLFGMLTVVMGIGVVAAVATIQDTVSDRARGTVVAVQSFVQTIVGLGCGPTAVALVGTTQLGRAGGLGACIALVVVPSLLFGSACALWACKPHSQGARLSESAG